MEDFIAWHMEKSGLFSVRSAYNLALRIKRGQGTSSSSSAPDGARKVWSRVWSGQVPPKVNVFTWKLARDSLPTRRAKYIRHLEASDTCALCGREPETSYHVTVTCPRAQGLRSAMREHWLLPDEEQFHYTGLDWFLLLLDQCSDTVRDLNKLLLWKTWSVHNNITHQKVPRVSLKLSISFYGCVHFPQTPPNFPSHRNHIETLNIANDPYIEY